MKQRKHRFGLKLLSALTCAAYLLCGTSALALDGFIYKTETEKTLALGVTLTQSKIFTQNGWQNISCVRANLNENPYIKTIPLFNQNGCSVGQSVLNMAKDHNTLAAINADFFDTVPGGGVSPIGTLVEGGNIVSTPAHDSGFATFYTDINGKPFFDYFTYSVKVTSPSGVSAPVKHINKFNFNGDIVYLDRNYKQTSIGSQNGKFELVVQNNVVVEKRENLPPVTIPENGYVLNCSLSYSRFLIDFFSVGETVVVDKYLTPDLGTIQTAVGTGSQILKDGQKTPITFDIAGVNPRSAVGFDRENNLYLLTVDGRQGTQALGMTTQQVADYLLEIGVTDAAILDGGGSTNLAAKDFVSGQQEIVNRPSQNSRAVTSGIGISSTAPVSALTGLTLIDDGENMFNSGSKAFRVVGYDQYLNRIEVDQSQVTYSVSGVEGSFHGSTFTAASPGTATITATFGGVSGQKTVTVLKDPVYLSIPSSAVTMSIGQTIDFRVEARDENGFSAPLPLYLLKVASQNALVQFNNHKLTALSSGEDYLQFSYKGLTIGAQVTVSGGTAASLSDGFEEANGRFTGYPSYVAGSYETSGEQAKSGTKSGRLSFDFTDSNDDLRAAYLEFSMPKALPSSTTKVGLWMYSDQNYGHMLRGMIYDASGQPVRIAFTDNISAGGWQYFEADVPSDLTYPATLSRLYVVQRDKSVKNAGRVYLDDLTIMAAQADGAILGSTPNRLSYTDPMHRAVEKKEGDFRFSVYGNVQPSGNLLQLLTNRRLANGINRSCDAAVFLGPVDMARLENVSPEKYVTYGYSASVHGDVTFVILDNSVDGLRVTNAAQWNWLLDTLDHIKTTNVMLFLPRKPDSASFSDPLELNLFYEVMTEKLYKKGKKAVVMYPGEYVDVDILNGVRYLSVANMPDVRVWNVVSNLPYLKYFEFTVSGGTLTYEVKSIF